MDGFLIGLGKSSIQFKCDVLLSKRKPPRLNNFWRSNSVTTLPLSPGTLCCWTRALYRWMSLQTPYCFRDVRMAMSGRVDLLSTGIRNMDSSSFSNTVIGTVRIHWFIFTSVILQFQTRWAYDFVFSLYCILSLLNRIRFAIVRPFVSGRSIGNTRRETKLSTIFTGRFLDRTVMTTTCVTFTLKYTYLYLVHFEV